MRITSHKRCVGSIQSQSNSRHIRIMTTMVQMCLGQVYIYILIVFQTLSEIYVPFVVTYERMCVCLKGFNFSLFALPLCLRAD